MSRANQTGKVEKDSYQILIIEDDLAVAENFQVGWWVSLMRRMIRKRPGVYPGRVTKCVG